MKRQLTFKSPKAWLVCGFVCVALAIISSAALAQTNDRQVLSALYGACKCGTANICSGSTTGCPATVCGTPDTICATVTQYYPTTTCVTGTNPGTCSSGSSYLCWEQYRCLCTDYTWPQDNKCDTRGVTLGSESVTKKTCIR